MCGNARRTPFAQRQADRAVLLLSPRAQISMKILVGVASQFQNLSWILVSSHVARSWYSSAVKNWSIPGSGVIGAVRPCDVGLFGDALDVMPPVLQQFFIGQKATREAPGKIFGVKYMPKPQHHRFWDGKIIRRCRESATSRGLRTGRTATDLCSDRPRATKCMEQIGKSVGL